MNPESFDVIHGTIEANDLYLTTVARARIHFANVQRTPQDFIDPHLQLAANGLDRLPDWGRRGFEGPPLPSPLLPRRGGGKPFFAWLRRLPQKRFMSAVGAEPVLGGCP